MDTVTGLVESQMEFLGDILSRLGVPLASLAIGAALLSVIILVGWFGLTYGLRRQERARCFFALLETGLQQGLTPEHTVLALARAQVRDLGNGLHWVAAQVETGMRLGPALEAAPSFLPPHCRALYRAAEATGDLRRALPACRVALRDASSGTLVATNNLMTLLFVSPAGPLLVWMCSVWVVPKLKAIVADMLPDGGGAPARFFDYSATVAGVTMAIWVAYWGLMCVQYGGPWLRRWFEPVLGAVRDRLNYALPWRRWRMQRDFSVMLGLALDCGVPEPKALALAAQATGNGRFVARAARAGTELERGVRLPQAVAGLDRSGEFAWRLRNAAGGRAGFAAALAGWHETLAARAFQREQTASQLLTTGLVFLNATMVGLLAVGLFSVFVEIIQGIE